MSKNNVIKNGSKEIYEIIKNENRFMTLPEIYNKYIELHPDNSKTKEGLESMIRSKFIYSRCLDRFLRDEKLEPLFFSLSPRKTRGNQIGIIEWLDSYNIADNREVDSAEIDKILDRIPDKPQFDDEVAELANSSTKEAVITQRNRRKFFMVKALVRANYLCEIDCNHPSFIRKNNKKNYTEAHHLIPLQYQNDFEYSLDCSANIISLCSNCHNQLHYGLYKKQLLYKLFEQRKEILIKYKIEISFDKLLKYYGVEENDE